MQPSEYPVADAITSYIQATPNRAATAAALDMAKRSLADWLAVTLAARELREAHLFASVADLWSSGGRSRLLTGGRSSPPVSAFVNGSMSHLLDYDDVHTGANFHGGGPIWALLLAGYDEQSPCGHALLNAYCTGMEVGCWLGESSAIGQRLASAGWHATGVLGRYAAAAAGCAVARMTETEIQCALGIVATQASGLEVAFGTHAKSAHIGMCALNSVMAIDLAKRGLSGPRNIFDSGKGGFQTLLRDADLTFHLDRLGTDRVLDNSFKPYAACQFSHASIDAAKGMRKRFTPDHCGQLIAYVNPMASEVAAVRHPKNSEQAKFSIPYCIALALRGYPLDAKDFYDLRLSQEEIHLLAARVQVIGDPSLSRHSARLRMQTVHGEWYEENVDFAVGSPGNPLGWSGIGDKFLSAAEAQLASPSAAGELFACVRELEARGALDTLIHLLDRLPPLRTTH